MANKEIFRVDFHVRKFSLELHHSLIEPRKVSSGLDRNATFAKHWSTSLSPLSLTHHFVIDLIEKHAAETLLV